MSAFFGFYSIIYSNQQQIAQYLQFKFSQMWEKVKNYIEGYINHTHMQSLTIFQNLLQQSLHLEFIPEKLTKYTSDGVLNKKTSASLQVGLNKSASISIIILRSIHSNNFTFLMTSEKLPVYDINKFIFVVVVWPKEGEMINRWKEELSLNMWVTVRQPYKASRDDDTIYLVVRLQNLVIQQGKRWKQKSQSVKQKANMLYKKQQFMQAFTMYEFALCNNHQHHKNRQRAILYANSAACLFEMRLFSSSVIYCDLAIKCDSSYPKGYFRKISSLLQGSSYSTVPGCLLKLKTLISNPQFEPINQKYTNYMTNDIGIYNWGDLFKNGDKEKLCEFGQYHSNKVQIRKTDKGEFYVARQDIMQYELILVNKPLVHFRLMNDTKKNFEIVLDQVKKNCLLQKEFYEMMKICLPRTLQKQKQQLSSQPRTYHFPPKNPSKIQQVFTEDQLIKKLQRSLMMERHIDQIGDQIGYGLWKDSFYLPLQCDGNCTYVHLRLAFVVWASKNIKKGQTLNIDYLSGVQGLRRHQIMEMKYHRQCECMYCTLIQWPQNYVGDIQGLYMIIDNLPDNKTKKMITWQIIIKKANNQSEASMYDGLFPGILYRYMIFIQKDPQWEDIINLMVILRDAQNKELASALTKCVQNCLNKYLKIRYSQQRLQMNSNEVSK